MAMAWLSLSILTDCRHADALADALLDACRKRARPIVMTTVAMGAGMMPIAIGLGTDPSFRAPMAIVVIGGLVSSTALTLVLLPILFRRFGVNPTLAFTENAHA